MASKKTLTIFLVDDDSFYLETMQQSLSGGKGSEYIFESFLSGEKCVENLYKNPDIIVLDHNLADSSHPDNMNGIETLKRIKDANPETEVIMLSGQDNIDIAIETINCGAYEYVVKSESALIRINNIVHNIEKNREIRKSFRKQDNFYKFATMIIIILVALAFILSRIFN